MADNIISPSKREIYGKLIELANIYFPDQDADFLKSGFMGYFNEVMAMMMRDSTYHTDMVYNESFLNTAIIPKSIYNWAKMFNIEVLKATPAKATAELKIPKDSVEQFMDDGKLVLPADTEILAGDYVFSLGRNVIISKDSSSSTSYNIKYDDNIETLPPFVSEDSYINKIGSDTNDNLIIQLPVYQYLVKNYNTQIVSESFLNKVQTFDFVDQFAGASLSYSDNTGASGEVPLEYSEIAADDSNITTKYALYNLSDEDTLEITFRNTTNGFMPTSNTVLNCKIYCTKGKNTPSAFSGIANVKIGTTDKFKLNSLPITAEFKPSTISGGKNAPTMSELKSTIINEISTRKTIATESDLNNYFAIIMSYIESINDGRVKFIKEQDDMIRRSFNAYLLIRDNTQVSYLNDSFTRSVASSNYVSSCVPTNTLDVIINNYSFSDNDSNEITPEKYVYDESVSSPQEYVGTLASEHDSTNGDGYMCPFTINISATHNIAGFSYDACNQTSTLIYNKSEVTTLPDISLIPDTLNVYRGYGSDGNLDENYIFSVQFTTDLQDTDDIESIRASLWLGDNNVRNNEDIKSQATVKDGKIVIKLQVPVVNVEKDSNVVSIRINAVRNHDASSNTSTSNSYVNTINVISSEEIKFRQQLNDIIESRIAIDGSTISIKGLPVVHRSFFKSYSGTTRMTGFVEQLFSYIDILKKNLSKLETSTSFNMKFYNTYGTSYLYDNTNTTNIDLRMKITLANEYKSNLSLQTEIREYVRKLVDSMNTDTTGISYSKIVASLRNSSTYGRYINDITFTGLSGTDQQTIKQISTSDATNKSYIPEWINLDYEKLYGTTGDSVASIDSDSMISFD